MKKLSIQSKKNALRYLAAVFAWTLAIAMLPVAEVQAAGFSSNGFDISSFVLGARENPNHKFFGITILPFLTELI